MKKMDHHQQQQQQATPDAEGSSPLLVVSVGECMGSDVNPDTTEGIKRAAAALRSATAILFTSGAGLGVDSGLPDFRGPQGFWRAYPPMKEMGIQFPGMSNPAWFDKDVQFAWGFWGHRYDLYTKAAPHEGYNIMLELGKGARDGFFSFTSNVDGHFAQVFPQDRIVECHGSVHYLQCHKGCSPDIWESTLSFNIDDLAIDMKTFKAMGTLPSCPKCGRVARPNVLMFGDWGWCEDRNDVQHDHYDAWLESIRQKEDTRLVIIEIGAGTAVPTVRMTGERLAATFDTLFGSGSSLLVRINPRDYHCPKNVPYVPIPLGGKDALTRIKAALQQS